MRLVNRKPGLRLQRRCKNDLGCSSNVPREWSSVICFRFGLSTLIHNCEWPTFLNQSIPRTLRLPLFTIVSDPHSSINSKNSPAVFVHNCERPTFPDRRHSYWIDQPKKPRLWSSSTIVNDSYSPAIQSPKPLLLSSSTIVNDPYFLINIMAYGTTLEISDGIWEL